ncbi:hypothetical protein niasHS_008183 [Heterodera schachtii]|uniref:Uncharacterized protein n=1 Tax=Heterodera schachtii TaxID=97005 RepID=A0ABD2J7U5_HETSC
MEAQFNKKHNTHERPFKVGDKVLFINYRDNKKFWLFGKIVRGSGVMWRIEAPCLSAIVTRHSNQMRLFNPIPYKETDQIQHSPQRVQAQSPPEQIKVEREITPPRALKKVRFADEQPHQRLIRR